ncbi:MAG: hypothetical protein JRN62_03495 [Nitrososphaerota archaeon]|jgi:hypothetical protein|nr:hypothetical protein [Nitrososphaerota archaeon]MDG6948664.1 hypothetical protein [Nitrososphaerota archaeon]
MTEQETEKEEPFYRQPGPEITPLAMEKGAIASELSELADGNGLIRVQLDAEAVLPRIANGIYANFESGFRETYANAITACLNAKELYCASPRIEITYDMTNRTLVIAEADSTGITYSMFRDVYVVVGRSGNFDPTKPGQFGFGRLAWTTLSDRMVLQTKYRTKDGQTGCFSVEGKNGMAFSILPTPAMETYGTTVSMAIYEKIDPLKLVAYIKHACKLSPIDTFLTLADGDKKERTKLNYTYASVMMETDRFLDSYASRYYSSGQYSYSELIKFTLPGFDVYAVNITQSTDSNSPSIPRIERDGTKAVLLNLPVATNLKLPFSRALICITDERTFPPTADRERLKEDTEEQLQAKLWPTLTQYFSKYSVHNVNEFIKLSKVDKAVLLFLANTNSWTDEAGQTLLDRETNALLGALRFGARVRGVHGRARRAQIIELASMLTEYKTDELFIEDEPYTFRHLKLLSQVYPRAIIIMADQDPRIMEIISQLNLKGAKKFITDNNLKMPKRPKSARGYTVHQSKARSTYSFVDETTTVADAKDVVVTGLIKIGRKDSVTKYSELLESFPTKYTITSAVDIKGGETLDEFTDRVEKTQQVTNKGTLLVKDLLTHDTIFLGMFDDPSIASTIYPNDKRVVILDKADRLFEIATYLTKNGKAFTFSIDPSEEFETITGTPFYQVHDGYGSRDHRINTAWLLLRIYAAAKDKKLALLLMKGVARSKDEDMAGDVELAINAVS